MSWESPALQTPRKINQILCRYEAKWQVLDIKHLYLPPYNIHSCSGSNDLRLCFYL